MPCSYCREAGHNISTCRQKVQDEIAEDEETARELEKILEKTRKRLTKAKARLNELVENKRGGATEPAPED